MAVGPVRPGIHLQNQGPIFRVGNAAGETHPLIGEGIGMALQSAVLLTNELAQLPPGALGEEVHNAIQVRYSTAWRHAFRHRLTLSRAYAHIAMHPFIARCVGATFRRWPHLLTYSARWAGKSRSACTTASPIHFFAP
jgi:flavin-dependent dehydrogenase